MRVSGSSSVSEFLGDDIVFRSLTPVNRRLTPFSAVAESGTRLGSVPRKIEAAYGSAVHRLLLEVRSLTSPGVPLERLIYIGDTRLSDGAAFANVCKAGGWAGIAFLADEEETPARVDLVTEENRVLYLANRWGGLDDFDRFCRSRSCAIDERAAVIVDLDKTALGARGRNDHVIDQARFHALARTLAGVLQDRFDEAAFAASYRRVNHPDFHPITADNQDYVAYVCLILSSGLYSLRTLEEDAGTGRLATFGQFLDDVDRRSRHLPTAVRALHDEVMDARRRSDPTPFKAVRRNEYLATVERMGTSAGAPDAPTILDQQIVITGEIRDAARIWRDRGALLFGLSDKPDEASIPTPELAARGYQPVHTMRTPVVVS